MRLPEPQRRRSVGENVIPLINVVFLLLIFFMIAGSLEQSEMLEVEPPESISERPLPSEAKRLLVSADGQLALQSDGAVTLDTLPAALGEQAPQLAVEVKADRDVAVPRLMDVLKALREAGVEEVELVTARDREQ